MARMVIVLPGNRLLEARLNGGAAAAQLARALPLELSLDRWGDGEYYGTLPVALSSKEGRRDVFAVGEIALWPAGNAFCVFFGPTPASRGDEPRMASPGIPLGRIVSDVSVLLPLGARLKVALKEGGT
jgi:hypothetical protein